MTTNPPSLRDISKSNVDKLKKIRTKIRDLEKEASSLSESIYAGMDASGTDKLSGKVWKVTRTKQERTIVSRADMPESVFRKYSRSISFNKLTFAKRK